MRDLVDDGLANLGAHVFFTGAHLADRLLVERDPVGHDAVVVGDAPAGEGYALVESEEIAPARFVLDDDGDVVHTRRERLRERRDGFSRELFESLIRNLEHVGSVPARPTTSNASDEPSIPGHAINSLSQQIGVTVVACVLFDHVEVDPANVACSLRVVSTTWDDFIE